MTLMIKLVICETKSETYSSKSSAYQESRCSELQLWISRSLPWYLHPQRNQEFDSQTKLWAAADIVG